MSDAAQTPPSPSRGTPLLKCAGLRVGYGEAAILPAIDIEVRPGEFWAVLGRNGSGKTTWFKTMLGLIPPVAGRVEWPSGETRVSYVPQRASFDDLFPVLARKVVSMGYDQGWSFLRPRLREPPEVRRALEAASALHLADRTFRSLSGGEKQRILLARMVVSHARLAFLDEPTAAMDVVAEREALDLVNELRRQYGLAVVVVSHYLGVARDFADRVILLDPECQEVVTGTPAEVFAHPVFRHSYGNPEELLLHG